MSSAGPNRHIDVAFSGANLLTIIHLRPVQCLLVIRCLLVAFVLFAFLVVGTIQGQEIEWRGRLKNKRTVTGQIAPGPAASLQLQSPNPKSDQPSRPPLLQELDLLELPNRSRTIPGIGMRRMVLANGDALHVSLSKGESDKQPGKLHNCIRVSFAASEYLIPWNSVAEVGPDLGMRCLAECDFESDHPGWLVTTWPQKDQAIKTEPGSVKLSQIKAASGRSSLICSPEQPELSWCPTERMSSGWLQFRFLTEPTARAEEPTVAVFQFQSGESGAGGVAHTPKSASAKSTADPQNDGSTQANRQAVRIDFNAQNGTIQASHSAGSNSNYQRLPCRPGWHLLTLAFTPQHRTIAIDGKLLIEVDNQDQRRDGLTGLNLIAGAGSNPLWIDDFQAWTATEHPKAQRDQFELDEVALRGSDKLFGEIQAISRNEIVLESQSMSARLDWPEIEGVFAGYRPYDARSLNGWHCRFALQPLWFDPGWTRADHLSGTLVEIGPTTATLQHCQLGKVVLSLQDLRQIQPLFQGIHLQLEGRPIHLGDEVDPTFQMPVPHGTKWNRSFHLDEVPAGRQILKLTCRDLEPASLKSLRTQRWTRLRNGEFVSEIRFNQAQPIILNHLTTGPGTELLPQSISVELPAGSLKTGHNELKLVLNPSHDQSPEFDDWELLDLAIRIEADAPSR